MIPAPLHEDESHAQLREQARRFANQHIAPHALEYEETETFPRELYAQAAEAGLLGVGYPEELGGGGGDLSHGLAVTEEMIVAGTSVGTVVGLTTLGIALPPLLLYGSDAQKEAFVRPTLAGRSIAALGVTEPGCGSDVAAIRTRAVRDGDHYVVNGSKTFISSGTRADFVTTAVRTGGEGHGGISLLVIETDRPGFSVSKKLKKTGWWASDTAELAFEDCRVPVQNLIGEENAGFIPIMQNFVSERLGIAGHCNAIARLAYQEAVTYAQSREAFGRPLKGFQVTRHKLADMWSRLMASRALTHDVLQRFLSGDATPAMAGAAKNTATDMCSFVCDHAVQIHGGYGYMRESVVERLFRDARLYPIGGGTREIMNEVIAKGEGY